MDEIVFSSLIAFNVMLTSHCDNVNKSLLCYILSLFRHALDHATIYLRKEIGKEITSKLF